MFGWFKKKPAPEVSAKKALPPHLESCAICGEAYSPDRRFQHWFTHTERFDTSSEDEASPLLERRGRTFTYVVRRPAMSGGGDHQLENEQKLAQYFGWAIATIRRMNPGGRLIGAVPLALGGTGRYVLTMMVMLETES